MGRTAAALGAALAVALIVGVPRFGAGAPANASPERDGARAGKAAPSTYRPGPITILGDSEQPGIVYFLPRAEVRFLPVRSDPELEAGPAGGDRRSVDVPR